MAKKAKTALDLCIELRKRVAALEARDLVYNDKIAKLESQIKSCVFWDSAVSQTVDADGKPIPPIEGDQR